MSNQEESREQAILSDRESRWRYRLGLAARFGVPIGTLTLNIPGPDKNPPGAARVLVALWEGFRQRLEGAGLMIIHMERHEGADGGAISGAVRGSAFEVKRCAVEVEEADRFGRLADIDILNADGTPMGREQLGLASRGCLLCDRAAVLCMREGRHDPEKIARHVLDLLKLSLLERQ